jgi:uncharacterized protein YbaP (TraB family)
MKMYKKISPVILLIIITGCIFGLSSQGEQRSFIFEVDYQGVKSYIMGSIHMLKKEHYPLKQVFMDSFNQSEILVVEADLYNINKFQLQSKIWEKAKYQGKGKLMDYISQSLFDKTSKILSQFGMTMEFYSQFKPWFVAMTIQGLQLVKLGFNPQLGIDMYFLNKAYKKKMKVLELEGALFQIELLDGFSMEEQVDFLNVSVLETNKMPEMVEKIIGFWDKGDVDKLDDLLNEEHENVKNDESLKEKFLYSRNKKMTKKIISWIKGKKSYFVIVGAAHLTGKRGIIQLLKREGLKINQL